MSGVPAPRPRKYLDREMDAAALEYYRRLAEGELATTRCGRCGRVDFPPRLRCPSCGGEDSEWVGLPREGRLHAFTTQERAIRFTAPTVLALAEVGEVVLPGIVEGSTIEDLAIGGEIAVELHPDPELDLTLLRFVPR